MHTQGGVRHMERRRPWLTPSHEEGLMLPDPKRPVSLAERRRIEAERRSRDTGFVRDIRGGRDQARGPRPARPEPRPARPETRPERQPSPCPPPCPELAGGAAALAGA